MKPNIHSSYKDFLTENMSIMEAYSEMGETPSHMPKSVEHKVSEDSDVIAHHFSPEHTEKVHDHLIKNGYKQAGASSVHGPATETRYVHPIKKTVAYIGKNKHTGWLDIQKG